MDQMHKSKKWKFSNQKKVLQDYTQKASSW